MAQTHTIEDLGRAFKAKYAGQYDDVPDIDLGKAVKAKYPNDYNDFADSTIAPSLLASRQAASKAEFEQNLPLGQRPDVSPEERAQPDPYTASPIQQAQLRDFFLNALEHLGGDLQHPLLGTAWNWAKGLGQLAGSHGPMGQLEAAKGTIENAVGGIPKMLHPSSPSEFAEGAGQTVAALPLIEGGARLVKKIPSPTATRNALAEAAKRKSSQMAARVMAPVVGPNKVRLGNMAADIGPEVMAQTKGLSKTGLRESIQNNLHEAEDTLHETTDNISPNTMYDTEPLIEALEKKRAALNVKGAANDPVTTGNRISEAGALDKAIEEAKRLGPSANFENLRKLRGDWDSGAKEIYTPAVAADYLKAQGRGIGYSKAAGAARDFLADVEPGTPEANARYHLWRQADDVMQAAEETERVRPTGLKTAGGRIAGAAMAKGGILGKLAGAAVGPAVEWALTGANTAKQIWLSRQLARLADALRTSDGPTSDAILSSIHDRIDLEGGLPPGIPGKGPVISPVKGGGQGPTNPPGPLVNPSGRAVVGKGGGGVTELLSPQSQGSPTGYGSYFKPEKPLSASGAAATPTGMTQANLMSAIERVARRLHGNDAQALTSPVNIRDLRAEFPGVSKADFDKAVYGLAEEGKAWVNPQDAPLASAKEQAISRITGGGKDFVGVQLREPPPLPSVPSFYKDIDSLRSPKAHLKPGASKADLTDYAQKLRTVAETNRVPNEIMTMIKKAETALKSGDHPTFVKEAENARLALRKEYGERLAAGEASKLGLDLPRQ